MKQKIEKAFKGQSLSTIVTSSQDDSQAQDKKLSKVVPKDFYVQLDNGIYHYGQFHLSVTNAIQIGKDIGLGDYEIALLIHEYCKGKVSRTTLWRYTKPLQDKQLAEVEESSSRSATGEADRIEESSSYDDNDDEQTGENLPLTETIDLGYLHESKQLSIDDFLSKEADGEHKFYFSNVSINHVKAELLGHGYQTIKRLYFEI